MPAVPHRSPLVMVVDNEHHHLLYHSNLLQRFGYSVCTAGSAHDAAELARGAAPALVVTELDMPRMSGLDLLHRLRSESSTAQVPVVALTRRGDNETEMRCLRAGFAASLKKPVGAEGLYRMVQACIERTPRRSLRVQADLPVTVNNVPLDGECASVISLQGMYICTPRPHPPKSLLSVQITVNGRTISADAVVLYSHQQGKGPFGEPGMGIKFDRILPEDQEHLRTFINSQVTEGVVLRASAS